MLSPTAYLAAARTHTPEAGPVVVVPVADALAAIEQALKDSAKYHGLLLRAVLHAKSEQLVTNS
ncbi:MAG: hypothetical protein ACRYFX_19060 [Janthinobacterium lividum]